MSNIVEMEKENIRISEDIEINNLASDIYKMVKSFDIKQIEKDMGISYSNFSKLFADTGKKNRLKFTKEKIAMFYWVFVKRRDKLIELCDKIENYLNSQF